MEIYQLVFPLRQCSSTPVGYGQGYLIKEQYDNTGTFPYFFNVTAADFVPVPRV